MLAVGLAIAGFATPATAAAATTATPPVAITLATIARWTTLAFGAHAVTFGRLAVLLIAGRFVVAVFSRAVRTAVVGGKLLAGRSWLPVGAVAFARPIAPAAAATAA
ncbi:MAG: hypothetical protein K2Y40_01580, partial [Reyranella sp.]|nr:hypothetical protein [Reyranella sp.]